MSTFFKICQSQGELARSGWIPLGVATISRQQKGKISFEDFTSFNGTLYQLNWLPVLMVSRKEMEKIKFKSTLSRDVNVLLK